MSMLLSRRTRIYRDLKTNKQIKSGCRLGCYTKHLDYFKDALRSNPTLWLLPKQLQTAKSSSKNSHDIPSPSHYSLWRYLVLGLTALSEGQ